MVKWEGPGHLSEVIDKSGPVALSPDPCSGKWSSDIGVYPFQRSCALSDRALVWPFPHTAQCALVTEADAFDGFDPRGHADQLLEVLIAKMAKSLMPYLHVRTLDGKGG